MVDHKSNSHTFFLAGSLAATPKLRLHGTVALNLSTSEFDEVEFPLEEIEDRGGPILRIRPVTWRMPTIPSQM